MTKPIFNIINGNSAEVLKTFPDNYFDAVVTDPPYGINFLGKDWDKDTGEEEVYRQCLRVLKPGGYILAFSAARTYHHLAMAVERAGFQIRDQIMWVYGSGFPKSQDIGKAIDRASGVDRIVLGTQTPGIAPGSNNIIGGNKNPVPLYAHTTDAAKQWAGWGNALKPSHEPIVMAQKPFKGSLYKHVQEHGVGALNIDASRVGDEEITTVDGFGKQHDDHDWKSLTTYGTINQTHTGRFPANLIHDGSEEVVDLFPYSTSGARSSEHKIKGADTGEKKGLWGEEYNHGVYRAQPYQDAPASEGSAARFFYCAKVSKSERNVGCEDIEPKLQEAAHFRPNQLEKALNGEDGNPFGRYTPTNNNHPTVKPVQLMKYLIRLVTPPNSKVLDPFNGSGSTGMAAVELGHEYTGIELDPNYVTIAERRIQAWYEKTKPTSTYNKLFTEGDSE